MPHERGHEDDEARRQAPYDARSETGARESAWDTRDEGRERLQLREEELRARTEAVQAGEVQLRKEIVAEERTLEVPVTREEVVIERRPVEGYRPADSDIGTDEEIRVPVMEEQVTVEKQPVVVEEIDVGKRVIEETERVSGTVRREEARIEHEGDVQVHGDPASGRDARDLRRG